MELVSGKAGHWPKDGSIPEHVSTFIDWMLTPEWERPDGQKNQAEWCRANSVHVETVKGWKRRPVVKQAIAKRAEELNLDTVRIQRVIDALFRAAERGDVKAAALVLQYADKLQPKRIIIEDRTLAGMSDAQLREQLAAAGMLADVDD